MKKIIERLLVFIIGIPVVFALVIYLPFRHNLALNIFVILFSAMGAVEFSTMLEKKNIIISKIESFILGAVLPLAFTLFVSLEIPSFITPILIMAGAVWVLLSKVFSRSSETDSIISQITGKFALLVYPGLFMCCIVAMSFLEKPPVTLLFLFITFGSDSTAWLFGTLFGANNRGIFPVSPNKSVAGFLGGILGSVIVAAGAALLFPNIFHSAILSVYYPEISSSKIIVLAVILGVCTSIAASLGDLAESAIKRSCNFKDSGNLMLGRGGVLDSIDSIALAAPIYYFLFRMLFKL